MAYIQRAFGAWELQWTAECGRVTHRRGSLGELTAWCRRNGLSWVEV